METASVVVPAYNAEKTVVKCLKALKRQTYKPTEIIIVDDGSSDGTASVAGKIRGIRVVRQKHRGPAAARNTGAKQARGNIIVFTDADCEPSPGWLHEMLKPFSDKSVTGVQGAYRTRQKSILARFAQCEIEERYSRMRKRRYIDFIGTYSAAYRRRIFLDAGGFDETFSSASGEDTELSFRLAKQGKKLVFNPAAVVYHMHPDTLGKYLRQKFWRAYWRVRLYKKHPKKVVNESYTPQTLKIQIVFLVLGLAAMALFPLLDLTPVAGLFFTLLVISTLPDSFRFFHRDKTAGIIAPLVLLLRTIVFSAGLVFGNLML